MIIKSLCQENINNELLEMKEMKLYFKFKIKNEFLPKYISINESIKYYNNEVYEIAKGF